MNKAAQNQRIIEKLRQAGVTLTAEAAKLRELPLAGMKFVVTGRLEAFTRQEVEARIKKLGGAVSSSITRETDYLVMGVDPGSKLDKARALDTKTLSEAALLQFIEERLNLTGS